MIINTLQFGELHVEGTEVFTFTQGIPGFEEYRHYFFIQSEPDSPFIIMQCMDNGDVSLIITNPFVYYPNYDFEIPDSVVSELDIQSVQDVAVWAVVAVRDQPSDATLNLLAPIIVNVVNRRAKQIIVHNSNYQTKHKLVSPISAK
jgi:flagellar assembly factor FliW